MFDEAGPGTNCERMLTCERSLCVHTSEFSPSRGCQRGDTQRSMQSGKVLRDRRTSLGLTCPEGLGDSACSAGRLTLREAPGLSEDPETFERRWMPLNPVHPPKLWMLACYEEGPTQPKPASFVGRAQTRPVWLDATGGPSGPEPSTSGQLGAGVANRCSLLGFSYRRILSPSALLQT